MNYLVIQLSRQEALVARFGARRGGFVFTEASRRPLAEGEPLPALLEGLAAATGEERIILVLPADILFLRELALPITDRRRLREVVPQELSGETALESDDLVFDALPLADGNVLALWGRQREVAQRIELLSEQGLEPEIATVGSCHWTQLLPFGEVSGPVAMTDGEALAVFQDGALLFLRVLSSQAPAAEVTRTLALLEMAKGMRVTRVYLHGEAAREIAEYPAPGESEIDWLSLPVRGELDAVFSGDAAMAADLAGAYAAALAAQQGDAVNLRTGPLAYTAGRTRLHRRLRLTAILAAVLLLLICAEAAVRYYLIQRDLASVNASIAAIYREIFPTRKKAVDEVAELRSEIKRLGSGEPGGNILAVLNKVAEAKGDDVSTVFEAEIEGGQVRLKGDARSIQAVNDFKARAAKLFAVADVGEIKSRPDGTVSFVFRGSSTEDKK